MRHSELAIAARDAYDDVTFSDGSAQCLVCASADGHSRIYAFRGTKGGVDVAVDLRIVPWHDAALGWCHAGFLKAARGLWPLIRIDLIDAIRANPKVEIYFDGHSMGGAEAQITAGWAVKLLGIMPAGIVTFGSPRCAFEQLRRILASVPVTLYERSGDPVPKMPHANRVFFRYRKTRAPSPITGPELDGFDEHSIDGYIHDITALEAAAAGLSEDG